MSLHIYIPIKIQFINKGKMRHFRQIKPARICNQKIPLQKKDPRRKNKDNRSNENQEK